MLGKLTFADLAMAVATSTIEPFGPRYANSQPHMFRARMRMVAQSNIYKRGPIEVHHTTSARMALSTSIGPRLYNLDCTSLPQCVDHGDSRSHTSNHLLSTCCGRSTTHSSMCCCCSLVPGKSFQAPGLKDFRDLITWRDGILGRPGLQ